MQFFFNILAHADGAFRDSLLINYMKGTFAFPIYNNVKGDRTYKDEHLKFLPFVTFALGRKMREDYSLELEGLYRNSDFRAQNTTIGSSGFSFESYGVFLNAIFHPTRMSKPQLQPFLGGGIGYIHNNSGDPSYYAHGIHVTGGNLTGHNTNNFAYQLFIGNNYQLNRNCFLNTNLRWIYFGKIANNYVHTSHVWKEKLGSLILDIGIKYNFNH